MKLLLLNREVVSVRFLVVLKLTGIQPQNEVKKH